jgi:hypothetical protein
MSKPMLISIHFLEKWDRILWEQAWEPQVLVLSPQ